MAARNAKHSALRAGLPGLKQDGIGGAPRPPRRNGVSAPPPVKWATWVALAVVLALGLLAPPPHGEHFWENIPIFEAVFGFFGCLIIILVSKALGHLFIQKREDYYDD